MHRRPAIRAAASSVGRALPLSGRSMAQPPPLCPPAAVLPAAGAGPPPPSLLYRQFVNRTQEGIDLHRALDHATELLDDAERVPGAAFISAFLPEGPWACYRKECSYLGALDATDGSYGRDPGNWAYAVAFRVWLSGGPPLAQWQFDMADSMGDEKLGDVLEATLSLGRPGNPWRDRALPHVGAITELVRCVEAVSRWAVRAGVVGSRWPSSRDMALWLL